MTSRETFSLVVQVVTLANVLVMTVGFCLSIVAVRGFDGAPIDRMLRPLPVAFGAFILVSVPRVVPAVLQVPGYGTLYGVAYSVGLLAVVASALQAVYLLTERRDL
jgi:hypothetical protein